MSEFKKGQIVYVSDDEKNWYVSHFVALDGLKFGASCNKLNDAHSCAGFYNHCLSIEDYENMLATPKDKQPVYAWDDKDKFIKSMVFYDAKNNSIFDIITGRRGVLEFDHYEPIPEDKIPEWMIEAQKHLAD